MEGYRRISKYRAFLMGIAILWVLPVHLTFRFPGGLIGLPLRFLHVIGYGGVDIFLLLSGFGLYCSLLNDARPGAFYLRRLKRLLPAYLPAVAIWIAIHLLWNSITLTEALGNVFSVGWWCGLGKQFNWYTQAIFAYYLLAPLVFKLIQKTKHPPLTAALLFAGAFACGIPAIGRDQLLFASRLPIFLLGMYAGKSFCENRTISKVLAAWLYAAMAAGFLVLALLWYYLPEMTLWTYGLWWYPFLVITPGLCLLLTKVAEWLDSTCAGSLVAGLSRIGTCSYEIYLMHFIELQLLDWLIPVNTATRLMLIVSSVLTGLLYQKLIATLRNCKQNRA